MSGTKAGLIGKASAQEDFTVLRPADGGDQEVEGLVRRCLQMHIESGAASNAFLFARGGSWWLCRAENEAGTDAAGRPLTRIRFARLAEYGPAAPVWAMDRAARESFADAQDLAVYLSAPAVPVATPGARRALVALLVGAEVAVVASAGEAAWTSAEWGPDEDLAFMAAAGRVPWQFPVGRLLVISTVNWVPLMAIRDLSGRIGEWNIPNVAGLRAISHPSGRRRVLAAWTEEKPLDGVESPDAEMSWLLSAGFRRHELIARASMELRRRWLEERRLSAAEVLECRASWGDPDRRPLARMLRGAPGGLQAFLERFDPTPEDIADLLGSEDGEAFAWVAAGCEADPAEQAAERLERLAAAGALARFGLGALSAACATCRTPALLRSWSAAAVRAGMPPEVAGTLTGGPIPAQAPAGVPAPAPSPAWLIAVPPWILFEQGRWAGRDRRWRAWWTDALRQHPDAAMAPSARMEFSEPALAWLTGATSDGEMPASSALETLARWLAAEPRPDSAAVQGVLEACGISEAPFWTEWTGGHASLAGREPAAERVAVLRRLVRARMADLGRVVACVERGASAAWLAGLIGRSGLALIGAGNANASPPSAPPHDWDEALAPLLSAAMARPAFWNRWREMGIGREMAEWLASSARGFPGGTLAEVVAAAIRGQARLEIATLEVARGALERAVRVEQAMLWADAPACERRRAFALLRGGCVARPLDWLEARLSLWGFRAPPSAGWSARELAALLPWLDPIWVVQTVMSRRNIEAREEILLERVTAALEQHGYPASPPPPEWAARLRPEWVRRLAGLPGWELWADDALSHLEERK